MARVEKQSYCPVCTAAESLQRRDHPAPIHVGQCLDFEPNLLQGLADGHSVVWGILKRAGWSIGAISDDERDPGGMDAGKTLNGYNTGQTILVQALTIDY